MTRVNGFATPKVELVQADTTSPLVLYEFQVDGTKASDSSVDVLLIHGLTGHPIDTWGTWPKKVAADLSGCVTVWSFGYPAPLFDWKLGTTAEDFATEGRTALGELVRLGFGKKPIVFLTHSLGGLLAKSIISEAAKHPQDSSEYALFSNTHAVIFAGTPHAGSGQARWRLLVPTAVNYAVKGVSALIASAALAFLAIPLLSVTLLGRTWAVTVGGVVAALFGLMLLAVAKTMTLPGRHLVMLDPANPTLASLTRDFRQAQFRRKFDVDSFYEQKRLWGVFLVVPRWSADPGITNSDPRGIPADHIRMCKEPHAKQLHLAIEDRVRNAGRGKDAPVFRQRIKRLLKTPDEQDAFAILFEKKEGDRGGKERAFRGFLRRVIADGEISPTELELDLAMHSQFDDDVLVWCLCQELRITETLRRLRECASRTVQDDFRSAQANDGRTLIPFYRMMRTIEHVILGDLQGRSASKNDRYLLLETIGEATEKLAVLANKGVDGHGQTRRILLRLRSTGDLLSSTSASLVTQLYLFLHVGPRKSAVVMLDT
jgi:hypothetical protein